MKSSADSNFGHLIISKRLSNSGMSFFPLELTSRDVHSQTKKRTQSYCIENWQYNFSKLSEKFQNQKNSIREWHSWLLFSYSHHSGLFFVSQNNVMCIHIFMYSYILWFIKHVIIVMLFKLELIKQWHDWATVQNNHIHVHINTAVLMTISSGPLASNTALGLDSASWKCFIKMCTHTFSFCKQHYSNERLIYSWMRIFM